MTPPAAPNISSQLAVLTERIEAQGKTLVKLEEHLSNIDRRLTESENARSTWISQYERTHAILESKTDAAHHRIDEHVNDDMPKWAKVDKLGEEVKEMRDIVLALQHANRLLSWFMGIIGSTVIIWLLTQLLQTI